MRNLARQRVLQLIEEMNVDVLMTYITIGESLAEQFPRPAIGLNLGLVYEEDQADATSLAPPLSGGAHNSVIRKQVGQPLQQSLNA